MKTRVFLYAILITIAGLTSCQKDWLNFSNGLNSQENAAITEMVGTVIKSSVSSDVQMIGTNSMSPLGIMGKVGDGGHKGNFPMFGPMFKMPNFSDCATITVSNASFPKVVTVDFGTSCTDRRGMTRTGKIIIEMSDTLIAAGASHTITFQDVYFGNTKVEFTGTRKNLGKNEKGNWVIESSANQTMTKDDGDTRKHVTTEKVEWISGFETSDHSDDVYYTTGSGSVTLADGTTFSRTITTPLLFDATCGYIKSGVVELVNSDGKTTIDYGTGDCDNTATLTKPDGTTEDIDIRSCRLGKEDGHGKGGKDGKHGMESKSWFGF
jgi:hypothetical protein